MIPKNCFSTVYLCSTICVRREEVFCDMLGLTFDGVTKGLVEIHCVTVNHVSDFAVLPECRRYRPFLLWDLIIGTLKL